MKLTPLEIKKQTFELGFRGYDTAEVDAYLTMLSNEWEHMLNRVEELEERIHELTEKLKHYEKVEQALHETLHTAKESASAKKGEAEKEAALLLKQAEHEADKLLMDAKSERIAIREQVQRWVEKREEILVELGSILDRLQHSVRSYAEQKISLPEGDSTTPSSPKIDSVTTTPSPESLESSETSSTPKIDDAEASSAATIESSETSATIEYEANPQAKTEDKPAAKDDLDDLLDQLDV